MNVCGSSRSSQLLLLASLLALSACGGGGGDSGPSATAADAPPGATVSAAANDGIRHALAAQTTAATPITTVADATRLAHQATFGPNEALTTDIRNAGAASWLQSQIALSVSRYTLGQGDAVHKNTSNTSFCSLPANKSSTCWRDAYSAIPLLYDFYRNATQQPDQLRQRVAFALQQVLVVSDNKVTGTYGFRVYYNALLANALGNYRDVLKKVALSPLMGAYLDNVNNDKSAPNENFGRELLQLFSVGACDLNADGSMKGGTCQPTYDNDTVRNYAYALTGWTYPVGGATAWGCSPSGTNCPYFASDMVTVSARHDATERRLLSNVTVPTGSTAPQALELVLDSVMKHPNTAPFIGRQLIQHLVTGNPSPAYVSRVAAAFAAGKFSAGSLVFGKGVPGDLAATVAAILLDVEARSPSANASAGKLREPVLMMAGVLRALNGRSDGDALAWQWGDPLRQRVFTPPSVFNFYPPDYPVPGTTLVGPAFGIHNANTALGRLNYLTYLMYWGGSGPNTSVPGAFGTKANLVPFETSAADAGALVDRLSLLAIGMPLPAATRNELVAAVNTITSAGYPTTWKTERTKQAAYLVFATPDYQIQR